MKGRWITRTLAVAAMGALALVLAPAPAGAQNTQFNVTADVARSCRISATDLDFGAYDPVVTHATVPRDSTSEISVACTRGTSGLWVSLDVGQYANGTIRQMASGTDRLPYELYSDSAGGTVWGTVQTASNSWAVFPNHSPVARTVYGRIEPAQDVPVGSYADVITATITF